MPGRLSAVSEAHVDLVAHASLRLETRGPGLTEITAEARRFIDQLGAGDGVLLVFLRHTSASLTIQENADPDVQTDLVAALDRLAPQGPHWVHDT
ncbi:MAG TPA: YjbQ family protein, partial [Pseudolabrys sp.]|nr:YjbQ family protein [Pseudolabrys sp.]